MKRKKFEDDGHTVFNMDGVEDPGHFSTKTKDSVTLSKEERRAAVKAALAHYMPIVLAVLGCFGLAMLVICLWLR